MINGHEDLYNLLHTIILVLHKCYIRCSFISIFKALGPILIIWVCLQIAVKLFLWIQNTYHLKCGVCYYKEWFNCINVHICSIYVFTGYTYVKIKREVRWNWIVFTSWFHHIFSSPKRWCYSPALVTSGFGNHSRTASPPHTFCFS